VYDLTAKPLPEIPLPNDVATRLDPNSPTGRRLNFSTQAPTSHEQITRSRFNQLDGFGAYAPIFVSFDQLLDLDDLDRRHNDNDDFRDDAVYLLNVDEDCQRFGEEVALDMGRGRFPATLWTSQESIPDPEAPSGHRLGDGNRFFAFDAHGTQNNILFDERNEDLDGDGVLDPGEDVDGDGVLDAANLDDPQACDALAPSSVEHRRCIADHLLTHYERQTNTLILRPIWPLEQQCTYAVLLTNRLTGTNGKGVESPFEGINHRDQTRALRGSEPFLSRYDLDVADIGFAWTFTVGSMTLDLDVLREGLYGGGPLAQLANEFPVSSFHPWNRAELAAMEGLEPTEGKEQERLFEGSCVGNSLSWLWSRGLNEWDANLCSIETDLSSLGGVFGGTFSAPNLLVDKDGIATELYPADNDEVWELDPVRGEAVYGTTDVTFWCALPQEGGADCVEGNPDGKPFCAPFPVIFYAHGYGGSRAEISLHIGRHTAMGYAMCGLDSYGHGLNRFLYGDTPESLGVQLAFQRFGSDGVRELAGLMMAGRDRDLNNDGLPDPGMDMWTNDVFHTRDMVRQSVLEEVQFVRILRSFDGTNLGEDGLLLGDIDGDGQVDLGGPTNTIGMWGISLGGILSGVAAGAVPELDAVSPNAGGAGLADISTRSSQVGVPEAVIMPMIGPLIAGCLPVDDHQNPVPAGESGSDCMNTGAVDGPFLGGQLRIAAILQDEASRTRRELAGVDGVQVGDRIELRNLANGKVDRAWVNERGWFRLAVPADALDPIERRSLIGLSGDLHGLGVSSDNLALGDGLQLQVFVGDSDEVRASIDTFHLAVEFQGTLYPEGTDLIALQPGWGYQRNSPDLRRFLGFAQHALSSADPAVWLAESSPPRRLIMPTAGDSQVPVSSGVAMGRIAGVFGSWERDPDSYGPEVGWREMFEPDPRYGVSIDQWLMDVYAVEGVAALQRFDNPVNPNVIYDVDNISDGLATFSCGPSDWSASNGESECPDELQGTEVFFGVPHPLAGQELRQDRVREDGTFDSFRLPVLRPAGQHGIYNSQPFRTFDADAYMVDFTVRFLGTGGARVEHESGCDCSASSLPGLVVDGEPSYPSFGEACTELDLNICSAECIQAWGISTPEEAVCTSLHTD